MEYIATRESFGKALADLDDNDIYVLDADVDVSTKTSEFKKKHPKRFIEMGIAEADMIGTAAGLATCSKIPFVSTFAVFATGRCYDQIRESVCYPNLNVRICGTHSGITVGEDGATHQMIEDISLMRTLPNMKVICTSDDTQTKEIVKQMSEERKGPIYLRLSREKTPIIYTKDIEFKIGKGTQIGDGKDGTIFACGDTVYEAIKASEILRELNIDLRVCDMYSIKPIDKKLIVKSAKETGFLFSVEDHNVIGGLGSAISEVLCDEYPKKLERIGIKDKFGRSGKTEELKRMYGIDFSSIVEIVKSKFIANV